MAKMTLEEALAAATVDEELVTPVNEVLLINPETRTINVPDSEKLFGARQDMDVERKYFKCPRIVGDNIDLFEHRILVNYVPSKQDGSYDAKEEVQCYWCRDLAVEGDFVTFSWKLSENVTRSAGYIAFAVYAKTIDEYGNLQTKWHTTIAIGNVLDTLPDGEELAIVYPDIVMQLLERMDEVEKNGDNGTSDAVQYIEQTLTKEQQIQARTNIGAASANEVSKLSEDIADLKENGTSGGSGLNTTSQALLRQLLEATVYDSDVLPQPQVVIDAFFNSLGGGSDEPVEPDEPDVPVDPDEPVVTYTITNNLTNCTNSNTLTSIEKGSNYTAVISPNEGYELESVTVTHGGVNVTVTDGVFTIVSVSGDIVINANAIEESNEVVLYSIKDKVCNKDFSEPTGLRFGSDDANGVKNAWTITATAKSDAPIYNDVYHMHLDRGDITSNTFGWSESGNGPSTIRFATENHWNAPSLKNIASIVLTKEAGAIDKATLYYVSNGEIVSTLIDASAKHPTNLLNGVNSLGEVYVGGVNGLDDSQRNGFAGTIYDFTITLGKIYSEAEIASYLGV